MPMKQHLRNATWLHGSPRQFLGPNVSALVPLNLLAAAFSHSHSDASMRILHGYSSLGLVFGIYGSILLIIIPQALRERIQFACLLSVNLVCLWLNAWITIEGMDLSYGRQFHVVLALLFIVNFYATKRLSRYE